MRISDWSSDVCSSDLKLHPWTRCRGCPRPHRQSKGSIMNPHEGFLRTDRSKDARLRGKHDVPILPMPSETPIDRTDVELGKSVSVRVDTGGRSIMKKKKNQYEYRRHMR